MKLYIIPEKSDLELRFMYKDKEYCMDVNLQLKRTYTIYIQAICLNGKPIETNKIKDASLTYKTENGFYIFYELQIELVSYQGVYLYAVVSDNDVEKTNRRESFRVFIGEEYSLKVIRDDGKVNVYSGILKDISSTGVGFIMSHKIEPPAKIEVVVEVWYKVNTTLVGELVRVVELPNHKGFLYGCKLNGHNDLLNRYILRRQIHNKLKNASRKQQ